MPVLSEDRVGRALSALMDSNHRQDIVRQIQEMMDGMRDPEQLSLLGRIVDASQSSIKIQAEHRRDDPEWFEGTVWL